MKILNRFFIVFSIFFGSCHSSPKKAAIAGDIITIDISKNYPHKEIYIEEIADREYVPLETNKDILIDKYAKLHYVSEKFIVVTERGGGDIFIFGRSGKIVTHISRKGKGPEEYSTMSSVVFDEKNEEIFVFDYTERILVYSITGEYKRTLKCPADLRLTAYNFDDETILVYDTKNLYNDNYSKAPYMFLSKKDGNILSTLNIHLPVRYNTRVYDQFTDSSGQLFTYSSNLYVPNRRHDGQDFMIADVSSDTIYRLTKNKDLTPFIVRTPSVHSTEPHMICTPILKTDKFIVLFITALDYVAIKKEKVPSATILMYEFETGEIYSIDYRRTTDVDILQKNVDASLMDAIKFTDAFKENKLSGELEQLAATLDEEDNPVVVIEKFK